MKGKGAAYYLSYAAVWLLSQLPFGIWYGVSELLFLLLFWVFRYRRAVVSANLTRCFPDWTPAQRRRTERQFYRHFADLLVETVKGLTLSDRALARRVQVLNPEIAEAIAARTKGSILLASHHGNHEWLLARIDLLMRDKVPTYAIYSPFRPAFFDELMRELRERRGVQMLPMKRAMIQALRKLKQPSLIGFLADQSPNRSQAQFYMSFLGQPTAVHTSVARLALRAQVPVYYADMRKLRRGRYTLEIRPLPTENFLPDTPENQRRYTEFLNRPLEAAIREQPPYWLWSHRRWKHPMRPEDQRTSGLASTAKENNK